MLTALLRYFFPHRDSYEADRALREYMRIEHVSYYDVFPREASIPNSKYQSLRHYKGD